MKSLRSFWPNGAKLYGDLVSRAQRERLAYGASPTAEKRHKSENKEVAGGQVLCPFVHLYTHINPLNPHQSGTQTEKTEACFVESVHHRFPPHHLKTSGITQTGRRELEAREVTHTEMLITLELLFHTAVCARPSNDRINLEHLI